MKRNFALLLVLSMLFASQICIAQNTSKSDDNTRPVSAKGARKAHKGWKLVWADEFNDNKIDEKSWERCPANKADWGKHMSNIDSLCQEKDGVLQLHAINCPEGADDTRPFLTGGVQSRGRRSMQLGRFDVRARFDCAKGFWPAIWLMPDTKIPWPKGGEIDIMEHLSFETTLYQTVHSPHTLEHREPKSQSSFTSKIDPNVFNVYSVIIYEDRIEFYANNIKTGTYERMRPDKPDQFPYSEHPFYVILSAQLGGAWVGEVEPKDLPVRMDIDYVRFYQLK